MYLVTIEIRYFFRLRLVNITGGFYGFADEDR